MEQQRNFQLEEWTVQPSLNQLTRGDEAVRIEPKLMDVLIVLSKTPREVVSKDDIAAAVWPEVFISESVITRAIAGLRRAFEDDARSPRFIETILRRGYRLLVHPTEPPNQVAPRDGSTPGNPARGLSGLGNSDRGTSALGAAGVVPADSEGLVGADPLSPSDRPFVVGQWVRGARFYGREAEIREILAGPRNGIWLLGSRAVGKTSLLKQLEHLTADDGGANEGTVPKGGASYFPLFWDLQGTTEPNDFHEDFALALAEAEERLKRVGLSLDEVVAEDFFVSIGRLRRALRSRGKTLLLLWDEVEELVQLHEQWPVLLRKLRRALQSQEGIRTVLASGPGLWQLGGQRDDTSPFLHGFAPPVYLSSLREEAATGLVKQTQSPGGIAGIGDAEIIRELMHQCGQHPCLLQLLCLRFLESESVEAAVEAVTSDLSVRYFFSVDFDLLTPLEQEILLSLATQEEPGAPHDLRVEASSSELQSRLLHLERLGQVRRLDGDRLEVASPILRRWLQQKAVGVD